MSYARHDAAQPRCHVLLAAAISMFLVAWTASGQGAEFPLALDANFNGMVHTGEAGQPDAPNGFRSISDRALIVDGAAGSVDDFTSFLSGLTYDVVNASGDLDILHLGNRNTVDNGNWAFDPAPDGDMIGVQPDWLPDPDQTVVVQLVDPGITLDATSEIGLVYQISNGGGDFDVIFGFADGMSVTVTLNGPDWFGPFGGVPTAPGPGVSIQDNLGVDFTGAGGVDDGSPDATLVVSEAVISAAELLADLGFDVNGKTLTDITLGNASNTAAGHAVLAVTVTGSVTIPSGVPIPIADSTGLAVLTVLLALAGAALMRRRHAGA